MRLILIAYICPIYFKVLIKSFFTSGSELWLERKRIRKTSTKEYELNYIVNSRLSPYHAEILLINLDYI